MGIFGPPNVERLKARRDLKGLIKAASYKEDEKIRKAAVIALGELGDHRAVIPLTFCIHDPDRGVRIETAHSLGILGSVEAIPGLLVCLRDRDADVRRTAANALGQIGCVDAVEPLIANLRPNSGWGVFDAVADALGQIGDTRAIQPLTDLLLNFEASHSHESVVATLEQLGWKPGKDTAGAVYWITKGEVSRCVEIGAPAIPALIMRIQYYHSANIDAVVDTLAQFGQAAIDPLANLLKNENNCVDDRMAPAMVVLGKIGGPQAVEHLINSLSSHHHKVSEAAAIALSEIKDPLVVNRLISLLISRSSKGGERQQAELALSKMGPLAIEPLIALLENEDAYVRESAAVALGMGKVGDERVTLSLLAHLKDPDEYERVRLAAIRALAIGDERAIEPLFGIMRGVPGQRAAVLLEDSEQHCAMISLQSLLERFAQKLPISLLNVIAQTEDLNIGILHYYTGTTYGSKDTVDGELEPNTVCKRITEVDDCSKIRRLAQKEIENRSTPGVV